MFKRRYFFPRSVRNFAWDSSRYRISAKEIVLHPKENLDFVLELQMNTLTSIKERHFTVLQALIPIILHKKTDSPCEMQPSATQISKSFTIQETELRNQSKHHHEN